MTPFTSFKFASVIDDQCLNRIQSNNQSTFCNYISNESEIGSIHDFDISYINEIGVSSNCQENDKNDTKMKGEITSNNNCHRNLNSDKCEYFLDIAQDLQGENENKFISESTLSIYIDQNSNNAFSESGMNEIPKLNVKNIENIEHLDNIAIVEDIENIENLAIAEKIEKIESVENIESNFNNLENLRNIDNVENVEESIIIEKDPPAQTLDQPITTANTNEVVDDGKMSYEPELSIPTESSLETPSIPVQIETVQNTQANPDQPLDADLMPKPNLVPKCRCHSKRKRPIVEKCEGGKYDQHFLCKEECEMKRLTDSTLAKEFSYSEWSIKIKEVTSKIAKTQTVHLSMVQLALRLYMHALTGHVTDINSSDLRNTYSEFKQLLSSFSIREVIMELLNRFASSNDCISALLIRCWIRKHILNHSLEAMEIITLLINDHKLTSHEASFAYFTRGRLQHLYFGNAIAALNDYSFAIKKFGFFSDIFNNRGNLYADIYDEPELAIEDYNKALVIDPTFYLAYNNRGELLEDEFFDYSGALHDYSMALKYEPSYIVAHQNRANLIFRLNKFSVLGNL